jgi:4-diphosphocytidyl-2-C-methyl-D-erythritol kinase
MTAAVLRARAPAKVNLCLLVGPTRADGRHELVTVFDTVSLHDELTLRPAGPRATADVVACPGITGENLAARALAAFRAATGWDGPPLRLDIAKRIPVAGGMAGGSADAAAALRLAAAAAGVEDPGLLERLGADLGADVPSQVRGGRLLGLGAGEVLAPAPAGVAYGVLVLPVEAALPTPAVFARADELRAPRGRAELEAVAAGLRGADVLGGPHAAVNDLGAAAADLCPPVAGALAEARAAGADHALVSGSGPTVLGLFLGADGPERAAQAADALDGRRPAALAAAPVPAGFGAVEAQEAPAALGAVAARRPPAG